MGKWDLYDELIELVPSNLTVEQAFVSPHWIGIKSEVGLGLAMRFQDASTISPLTGKMKGMKLKDLAAYSKSWNFHEAALGVAAFNSYINSYENQKEYVENTPKEIVNISVFDLIEEKVKGKKVTIVGHFPRVELLSNICDLSILERKPTGIDLPDTACEFVIPESDFLFVTGVTLINKTYGRLSELAGDAQVYVVGPSTPLTDTMFKYNANVLAGSVVHNVENATSLFLEGAELKDANKGNIAFITKFKD